MLQNSESRLVLNQSCGNFVIMITLNHLLYAYSVYIYWFHFSLHFHWVPPQHVHICTVYVTDLATCISFQFWAKKKKKIFKPRSWDGHTAHFLQYNYPLRTKFPFALFHYCQCHWQLSCFFIIYSYVH